MQLLTLVMSPALHASNPLDPAEQSRLPRDPQELFPIPARRNSYNHYVAISSWRHVRHSLSDMYSEMLSSSESAVGELKLLNPRALVRACRSVKG